MKKLIAIILSITLIFSFMAVPASAKVGNLGESDPSFTESVTVSIFDKIGDFFHNLIAKIFGIFGADCPICDNHYGYGDAGGEGGYNKEEAAKMYNDAINKLKKHNTTVRIDYAKDVSTSVIEEAPTGSMKNLVESILKNLSGRTESGKNFTYNEQAKINSLVPPSDRDSALSGANVKEISVNKINDTTKIEFVLNEVEAYYDGTSTSGDAVYASVLNPVNIAAYDFGTGIYVTDANLIYDNVKVEAVLDSYGRIVSFKAVSDIDIGVNAKAGISFSTAVSVSIVEEFTVKY